jgi:hypothetical protein
MLSSTLTLEAKDFNTLGKCIYCCRPFTADRAPTHEHIIGRFAGGRVTILDGACIPCARKTNKMYETAVSATTFLAFRFWAKILDDKARGLLNMARGDALSGTESDFSIKVTPSTRPALFTLPVFPPPVFWSGKQAPGHSSMRVRTAKFFEEEAVIKTVCFFREDRCRRSQLEVRTYIKSATHDVTLRERHDLRALLLMLAKVGYCFAIALLGFEAFDGGPIRALLAGERTDLATFVGGYEGDIGCLPKNSLHILRLRERLGVLYVIVHLFASKDGHPFEVIIGTKA